jgi:adenosylcobinamide-GDP ribazoletransferase
MAADSRAGSSERPRAYAVRGAIQFLTRIPAPTPSAGRLDAAVAWFPLVGALVGTVIGAVVIATSQLVPMTIAAALGVLMGVLLTGAFHEDGLADIADAFAGGWSVEQRLEILKDPRHGSYGVAALSGSIIIRILAVAALAPAVAVAGLIAAHTLARAVAVASMRTGPLARPEGLGARYVSTVSIGRIVVAVISGLAISTVVIGWWVVPAILVAAVPAGAVIALARRRIGGLSGDVLGAIEQVAEIAVLITVVALAGHHELWWR